MSADSEIESLPAGLIENLHWPDPPEHVQTHISHLFFTSDRVYKIRKAVRFGFLSFATRDERNADCLREVTLNRRLSPDVYLGVAPVLSDAEGWRIGELGEALAHPSERDAGRAPEHCVVMRRLPGGRDAQSLLEAGSLEEEHVDAVAELIARFHLSHRLGPPSPFGEAEWQERVRAPIVDSLDLIREHAGDASVAKLAGRLLERLALALAARSDWIAGRRAHAVDGHGDLQLAHVWFEAEADSPAVIDCTEFNEDFRRIDAASEVAFFAMDLSYRGHPELAERFLSRYAYETDDFDLYSVVHLYQSYRAAVRSKVAVLAAEDPEIEPPQREAALQSARAHLALAARYLELESAPPGALILLTGVVGSGKSTVARALAEHLHGVVVSSDRTRKHLAGLRADDRSGGGGQPGGGLYSDTQKDAVYEALLERALPVLESGRSAILDASHPSAERRMHARAWAEGRGYAVLLVSAACAPETARAWLAEREREGRDPSDAGPDLYDWSVESYEAPDEWAAARLVRVRTDSPGWQADLTREPALPAPFAIPS